MADVFLGQIALFPFNFAPAGWALCNGQVLSISQNSALFALLGTQYGGNGTSNFALPNLNGAASRAVCGMGQGPGLSDYVIGETFGVTIVTLQGSQMPAHSHSMTLYKNATGATSVPTDGATMIDPPVNAFSASAPNATLGPGSITAVGGSQPHDNVQPVLELNWCIALTGIFPQRQ